MYAHSRTRAHTHILRFRDNSHNNAVGSLPVLWGVCTSVIFSPKEGDWVTGSSLGEETGVHVGNPCAVMLSCD